MGYTYADAINTFRRTKSYLYSNIEVYAVNRPVQADCLCEAEFGPGWRMADWNDLKQLYTDLGEELFVKFITEHLDIKSMYDSSSSKPHSLLLTKNGDLSYSGNRHYFATYTEKNTSWLCGYGYFPSGGCYQVHDDIDNYLVVLGSWYTCLPVLCKKVSDTRICTSDIIFPVLGEGICIGKDDSTSPITDVKSVFEEWVTECSTYTTTSFEVLQRLIKDSNCYAEEIVNSAVKAWCLLRVVYNRGLCTLDDLRVFLSPDNLLRLNNARYFIEVIVFSLLKNQYPTAALGDLFRELWSKYKEQYVAYYLSATPCPSEYFYLLVAHTCPNIPKEQIIDLLTKQRVKRLMPNINVKISKSVLLTGIPAVTYLTSYPGLFSVTGGHPKTTANIEVENSLIRPLKAERDETITTLTVDATSIIVVDPQLLQNPQDYRGNLVTPHEKNFSIKNSFYSQNPITWKDKYNESTLALADPADAPKYWGFNIKADLEQNPLLKGIENVLIAVYDYYTEVSNPDKGYAFYLSDAIDVQKASSNYSIPPSLLDFSNTTSLPSLNLNLLAHIVIEDETAVDKSGNYQVEWKGSAPYFNGESYIELTPEISFLGQEVNDYSASLFIRFRVEEHTENSLALFSFFKNKCSGNYDFATYLQPNGRIVHLLCGGSSLVVVNSSPLAPGDWHTLALVYSHNKGTLYTYVDGELVNTYTGGTMYMFGRFIIGGATTGEEGASDLFVGEIKEVRFYDRMLTTYEVKLLDKLTKI